MYSKIHVTITAGTVAVTSLVCAVVAIKSGADASPFFITTGTALGVIGGVAVPTSHD